MGWLFLAMVALPLLDLFLLVPLTVEIGFFNTVGLILLGGAVGAVWLRRSWADVMLSLSNDMAAGRSPDDHVIEGGMVAAGGLLLALPGLLSDVLGLLLMVRPLRRMLVPWVRRGAAAAAARGNLFVSFGGPSVGRGGPHGAGAGLHPKSVGARDEGARDRAAHFDHPVV